MTVHVIDALTPEGLGQRQPQGEGETRQRAPYTGAHGAGCRVSCSQGQSILPVESCGRV
jgi:hypothetical protein